MERDERSGRLWPSGQVQHRLALRALDLIPVPLEDWFEALAAEGRAALRALKVVPLNQYGRTATRLRLHNNRFRHLDPLSKSRNCDFVYYPKTPRVSTMQGE